MANAPSKARLYIEARPANGYGSCSGERRGKRGEDAKVGVEGYALKPAHSERLQAVLVFQPSEGALDSAATSGQVAPNASTRVGRAGADGSP